MLEYFPIFIPLGNNSPLAMDCYHLWFLTRVNSGRRRIAVNNGKHHVHTKLPLSWHHFQIQIIWTHHRSLKTALHSHVGLGFPRTQRRICDLFSFPTPKGRKQKASQSCPMCWDAVVSRQSLCSLMVLEKSTTHWDLRLRGSLKDLQEHLGSDTEQLLWETKRKYTYPSSH